MAPQVWGFRLQMALLTDRAFPLPIWLALHVDADTRPALVGQWSIVADDATLA
jgi:hypothetical protein